MDRKAELERKKAKLAALREEKDRRRREKEIKDMEEAAGRIGGGAGIDKDQRKWVSSKPHHKLRHFVPFY